MDLFSLLFLMNGDKNYVCVPIFIDSILQMLKRYSENPYILSGLSIIALLQPKLISDLFTFNRNYMF